MTNELFEFIRLLFFVTCFISVFMLVRGMIEGVDLVERAKVIFSVACWVWSLIVIATAIYLSPYILASGFYFIYQGMGK